MINNYRKNSVLCIELVQMTHRKLKVNRLTTNTLVNMLNILINSLLINTHNDVFKHCNSIRLCDISY